MTVFDPFDSNFAADSDRTIQLLQSGFLLGGTEDPTVTPIAALKGAIFVRWAQYGVGSVSLYQKQDDGLTTNWVPFSSSSGSVGLLQNTYFVAKNGDDGTADGSVAKPYLTVQAAINAAGAVATPTSRCVVFVMPGTYNENCTLKANVLVRGLGYNNTRITGTWTLDSSFTPSGDHRSGWADVGLYTPGTITADFSALSSNEGKLYAWNTRFGGAVTLSSFSSINQFLAFGCEFFGLLTLNGMNTQLNGCFAQNLAQISCNHSAGGANSLTTQGGTLFSITVNGSSGAYNAYLNHNTQDGASLTINGTGANIYASANSYPKRSLVTLSGGALSSQLHRTNDAFGVGYAPTTPGDWSAGTDTIQKALDEVGGRTEKVEYITLDAGMIAAKSVALSDSPRFASDVILIPEGGVSQKYGTDYIVTGNQVLWGGFGLDGILAVGDTIQIIYPK